MKSQKDLIKAKIDATRAQLESAGLKLEKTKIFAPFNGRIMEESVEEGQFAQIGQKLAVIFDISAVEIVIQVPGFKIPQLGMFHGKNSKFPAFAEVSEVNKLMREHGPEAIVRFRIAGRDLTWKGKVTRVQGQIDVATRTIPMVVEVKDPFKGVVPGKKPPLVPGMFVEVLLKGKLFKNVFKVPRAALHAGQVYLVTDGKLEIRKVKVVRVGREYVYIANGLKDGDKIVISPIAVPIPGQPMRIVAGK
jgi:RND family efflux transporter MFP subunit